MPFATAAKNVMLDALTVDLVSLHSDYPGTDGLSNELSGGSPAYARLAITMSAASGGNRDSSTQPQFDVPSGADVAVIGFWTNTGTVFRGWAPNGAASNTPQAAFALDTGDTIESVGHGLSDDDRVFMYPLADALPGGLSESVLYHVVNSTTDDFQVSLTQGGSAVAITADGDLVYQQCIVESFAQQGTFTLSDADLSL
jgi:hypothetical protein